MKGIILAGGFGTRLYPLTQIISKQLLPIYDKPMIYYPLSVLMLANIKDVLIITTSEDLLRFQKLFKCGSQLGMRFSYATQEKPNGIAEALIIAEKFIDQKPVALILGDNLFFGQGLSKLLQKASKRAHGATIFGYQVKNAERYGVVFLDENRKPTHLEEKPENPTSNLAVTGLYFYDAKAVQYAKELKPSKRGELEISDLNFRYLKEKDLHVEILNRGSAWLDAGTHTSLLQASQFIQTIEERQGFKIACVEEIAFTKGWIDQDRIISLAKDYNNDYGDYLLRLLENTYSYS